VVAFWLHRNVLEIRVEDVFDRQVELSAPGGELYLGCLRCSCHFMASCLSLIFAPASADDLNFLRAVPVVRKGKSRFAKPILITVTLQTQGASLHHEDGTLCGRSLARDWW
jgi:hypothetical protein